jgi:hypothetical protein
VTRLASQKFPYHREPARPSSAYPDRESIARPRIEVRLTHGDRFVKLLALVDSGADDCVFPLEVAQFLKLPLKRDAVHRYGGIGAGAITATFGTVALEVGKWTLWDFYVGFSDSPTVVPILGQNGFFGQFEITFNRPDEIIRLKEVPKRPRISNEGN